MFETLKFPIIFAGSILTLHRLSHAWPIQIAHESREPFMKPDDYAHIRSTGNIVYGSIATILLCSSYCIRPNIPYSPDSAFPSLKAALGRLNILFWVVLSPELVIFWAFRQWYHARNFARVYKDRGWTITHGHFAIMGGFVLFPYGDGDLDNGGQPIQVLSPSNFYSLFNEGWIDFPSVTEQDINAKGRAHPLLIGITLLQTTWFIIQCIARGSQGLEITHLEIITLGLIAVHALLLVAWWHKPLNVTDIIRIHSKRLPTSTTDPMHTLDISNSQVISQLDFTRQERFVSGKCAKVSSKLDIPPLITRQQRHKDGHFLIRSLVNKAWRIPRKLFDDYKQLLLFPVGLRSGETQVPVFYAPTTYFNVLGCVTFKSVLGSIFAFFYVCISWMNNFPTYQIRIIWYISSAISTLLPISFMIFVLVLPTAMRLVPAEWRPRVSRALRNFGAIVLVVMIAARVTLLVEVFVCLMFLRGRTRLAVQWTNYIPHVS